MTSKRQGRPEMTEEETRAFYRLARSPDGQVLIRRLLHIKELRQEADLLADGDVSQRNKGRVLEINDLLREFNEAEPPRREIPVDRNLRY